MRTDHHPRVLRDTRLPKTFLPFPHHVLPRHYSFTLGWALFCADVYHACSPLLSPTGCSRSEVVDSSRVWLSWCHHARALSSLLLFWQYDVALRQLFLSPNPLLHRIRVSIPWPSTTHLQYASPSITLVYIILCDALVRAKNSRQPASSGIAASKWEAFVIRSSLRLSPRAENK